MSRIPIGCCCCCYSQLHISGAGCANRPAGGTRPTQRTTPLRLHRPPVGTWSGSRELAMRHVAPTRGHNWRWRQCWIGLLHAHLAVPSPAAAQRNTHSRLVLSEMPTGHSHSSGR
eukprot:scaffold2036_cov115-Isochrysis_galbana.AAC.17